MKARPQTTAAAVAAGSAVVLILSMLLPWYRLDLPERVGGRKVNVPTYSAFEGLARSDVYLVVAAVLALVFGGVLLARLLADSPAPGLALLAAGVVALALVVYRGSSRPGKLLFGDVVDTTLQFGWFVSLVAAAAMAVSGLLAYLAGPRLQLEPDEFEEEEEAAESRQGGVPAQGEGAPGETSSGREAS
jgi:hypothetical protein